MLPAESFEKPANCVDGARGEGSHWRFHRQGGEQTMASQGGNNDIHGGSNVNDDQAGTSLGAIPEPTVGLLRLLSLGLLTIRRRR